VTPTTWSCPTCHLTLEAVAVTCGHQCPGQRGQWTDLIPGESTDQDNGRTDHDRVVTPWPDYRTSTSTLSTDAPAVPTDQPSDLMGWDRPPMPGTSHSCTDARRGTVGSAPSSGQTSPIDPPRRPLHHAATLPPGRQPSPLPALPPPSPPQTAPTSPSPTATVQHGNHHRGPVGTRTGACGPLDDHHPHPGWAPPTPGHPAGSSRRPCWRVADAGWGVSGKAKVGPDQHRVFSRTIAGVWRTGPMTRRKCDA
jgi:hypothetical protein